MAKRPRAAPRKTLEIRGKDLTSDSGVVSLHERKPKEEIYYLLTLTIGVSSEKGGDLFYVTIATPDALKARAPQQPTVMSSRAMMVVSDFDWSTIQAYLKEILKACEAETWSECAERLRRYFTWEYEDIHEAAGSPVMK